MQTTVGPAAIGELTSKLRALSADPTSISSDGEIVSNQMDAVRKNKKKSLLFFCTYASIGGSMGPYTLHEPTCISPPPPSSHLHELI